MFSSNSLSILGQPDIQYLFIEGLALTLQLFGLCFVLAFALGIALTITRMSLQPAEYLVRVFVEYHRNVPVLVQLLVWYFGVPQLIPQPLKPWADAHLTEFFYAVVALSLNSAAYITEDFRSGIRALPQGQYEAARALSLSHLRTLQLIMIPQAIRVAMPALVNQTLSLLKSTTLAMAIGVGELMYVARQVDGQTYATFAAFLVPTIVFLVLTQTVMALGDWLGRRSNRGRRGA
ncbi:amino acid ABC transporter permease [Neorhizobium sp. DT-125]|uniref:amino acid ABC transporter permease n=1 Tax=Neorhizobium sp. DT-125 TaxID=3396163 RepID=UPI003F1B393A